MKGNRSSTVMKLITKFSLAVLIIGINVIFYVFVFKEVSEFADYSYDFTYRIFGDEAVEPEPGHDVRVTILKGESSMNIASKLEDAKIIPDKYSFYVKLKLKDYDIMPGTFVLNTSMSYNDIINVISAYDNSVDEEKSVEDLESQI